MGNVNTYMSLLSKNLTTKILVNGVERTITFGGNGITNCHFSTSDEELQKAIESDSGYGKSFILVKGKLREKSELTASPVAGSNLKKCECAALKAENVELKIKNAELEQENLGLKAENAELKLKIAPTVILSDIPNADGRSGESISAKKVVAGITKVQEAREYFRENLNITSYSTPMPSREEMLKIAAENNIEFPDFQLT